MKALTKKTLLLLVMLIGMSMAAHAEVEWYKATSYAYKYTNDYGDWVDWTEWIDCEIDVKFDMDKDVIIIYSKETQAYDVIEAEEPESDGKGGVIVSFSVVDQDHDRGTVRLRVEENGNTQLYVDFANVMWVYNIEEQ